VNAVRPGVVATNIFGEGNPQEFFDNFAKDKHLIKRAGRSEEVARLVAFLLSDDSSLMTASLVDIDAGFTVYCN
jgi:NAD(P)-dependent dehydrogenase (short-subunit alcohol dehydrogenase family)